VALGWPVVDADVIARKVVEKGEPAWRALRDAFGTAVLTPEGQLDRAFMAEVAFHDASALKRLNRITHGYIGVEMANQVDSAEGAAVFVAIPLYRPEHTANLKLDEVWAIEVEPATAVERLIKYRQFSEDDAKARLAAQMSNEERAAIADRVIWNEGTLDELYANLDLAIGDLGVERD
jgi:dephospho-CoA kinase